MRGFAVLLVFFVHYDALYGVYLRVGSPLYEMSRFLGDIGNTGVDLFFVLSGYLIYGVVLRKKTPYGKFMRRRFERIYPTFLAVLLVYLLLCAVIPSENKIHGSFISAAAYLAANILLLPGIFHITPIVTVAWSLSYEFFFYFSIPLVVWVTRMGTWPRWSRVIFFATLWAAYLLYAFSAHHSEVRLLMFVAGILLYEAMDSNWTKAKLSRKGELLAITAFLAGLVFIFLYDAKTDWLSFLPGAHAGRTILPGVSGFQGPYKVVVLSITCLFLALYSFQFDGVLKAVFSWKPLRYLGNMSYSYYLIHGLALHAVAVVVARLTFSAKEGAIAYLIFLPIGFAFTWVVSTGLFLLIEKPISLKPRPAPKAPVSAPTTLPPAVVASE
ncbi:MAG TPA: acyltransferase [Candidatus Acidoferrales bacterium]|nr:acyltransferase [Candidatus Acidoferrales bacterium]